MPYWKVGAIKETLFEGSEAAELDQVADHKYDYVFKRRSVGVLYDAMLSLLQNIKSILSL